MQIDDARIEKLINDGKKKLKTLKSNGATPEAVARQQGKVEAYSYVRKVGA